MQIICRGCGKEENETKFKACPICIKLKMLPSMYCCEECFRADWKTHKKQHNNFSNAKTKYLESNQLEPGFERSDKILSQISQESERS